MKKLLFFTLLFLLSFGVYAVERFSTLEERMTGQEFNATGLGKLTSSELAALNDWLSRHSVATLDNASVTTSEDVPEAADPAQDEEEVKIIRSTIVGTFSGWSSKATMFQLSNGQLWQQAEKDVYIFEPAADVEVELRKPMMGRWRLSVVGTDREVKVKRIE